MASYCDGNIHICGLPESEILEMDTVLYYGFGGYVVREGKEIYYMGEHDKDWGSYKKLKDIEDVAKTRPHKRWTVELSEPLSGATWKRRKDGVWVVIERNQGFA